MKADFTQKRIILCVLLALAITLVTVVALSFAGYQRGAPKQDEAVSKSLGANGGYRNFLLLGRDRASGLTDVIMLASINADKRAVIVVQIPRDTYARYTDGSYKKLNGAMSSLGGASELCKLLSHTMCVDIEGYCVFDLDTLVKVVDAIGGVEIDLPFDMDYEDPYQGLSIHLSSGRQTLDGKAAEQFVRYRSGYIRGDLGRMDAQKLFVSAFIKKVSETVSPVALVRIIGAVIGDVRTNLGVVDLTKLALVALGVKAENMTMVTMAGNDVRMGGNGAWYYVISKSAAVSLMNEFLGADISTEDFDRDRLFFDPSRDELERIYYSDLPYYPQNAAELEKNGIKIEKH